MTWFYVTVQCLYEYNALFLAGDEYVPNIIYVDGWLSLFDQK